MFRFRSLGDLPHAISTRHGGVSPAPYSSLNVGYGTDDVEANVAANRATLLQSLGLAPRAVVAARLVHGSEISVFRWEERAQFPVTRLPVRNASNRVEPFFLSDGVVSDAAGQHFLLTCADCVPLLFYDPERNAMGAAHAGWRGTAAAIAVEVVNAMRSAFGSHPTDIVAGVGPSVGPCCYSVGRQVIDAFAEQGSQPTIERRDGRIFLDLWETNERQLYDAGVRRVEQAGICTACHVETYFSHRGEAGKTGRFALIAGLSK